MNNDSKVVAEVMSTTNYDAFKRLEENRDILEDRVKKIKASMDEKIIRNPIIVNEKMEIIDGQGRFTVLKNKGLPIEYIMVPGTGTKECQLMNRVQTNWSDLDFIKSYAQAGNQNYIRLMEAMKVSGYGARQVLRSVHIAERNESKVKNGVATTPLVIKSGVLKFSEDAYAKAVIKLEMLDDIKRALDQDKRVGTQFDFAAFVMFDWPGYDHRRMIDKCLKKRQDNYIFNTMEEQLKEFSKIYNYRARDFLYFEDYMRNKGKNVRSKY